MVDDTSHRSSKSVVLENEVSNHSDNNLPNPQCEIRRDCSIIRAGGNACNQMVNSSVDRSHLETKHLHCKAQDEEVSKLHSPSNDDTHAELAVQQVSDDDVAPRRENGTDEPLYKDQVQDIQTSKRHPMKQTSPCGKGLSFKDQVRNVRPVFVPRVGNASQANHDVDNVRTDARRHVTVNDISSSATMGEDDVVAHLVTDIAISAVAVVIEDDETGRVATNKRRMCFTVTAAVLLVSVVLLAMFSQEITSRLREDSATSPPSILNAKMVPISGCEDALPLFLGEIVIVSTVNKTVVSAPVCGNALPTNSPGVFLKYITDENLTWVRITTCTDDESLNGDFDSQMIVYTGACDRLQCIDGNDNELYTPSGCGSESGVTFRPNLYLADVYYVLVNGRQDHSSGTFGVQVKALSGETCENAVPLENYQMQSGSTVNATIQTVNGCGVVYGQTAPGVWYMYKTTLPVQGTTTVRVCRPGVFLHDHRIEVVSGKNCSNRESSCDYTPVSDGFCQVIVIYPEPSTTYYILVSALSTNATGDFTIEVDETESPSNMTYAENDSQSSGSYIVIIIVSILGSALFLLIFILVLRKHFKDQSLNH